MRPWVQILAMFSVLVVISVLGFVAGTLNPLSRAKPVMYVSMVVEDNVPEKTDPLIHAIYDIYAAFHAEWFVEVSKISTGDFCRSRGINFYEPGKLIVSGDETLRDWWMEEKVGYNFQCNGDLSGTDYFPEGCYTVSTTWVPFDPTKESFSTSDEFCVGEPL